MGRHDTDSSFVFFMLQWFIIKWLNKKNKNSLRILMHEKTLKDLQEATRKSGSCEGKQRNNEKLQNFVQYCTACLQVRALCVRKWKETQSWRYFLSFKESLLLHWVTLHVDFLTTWGAEDLQNFSVTQRMANIIIQIENTHNTIYLIQYFWPHNKWHNLCRTFLFYYTD